jgi:hypothetical protein
MWNRGVLLRPTEIVVRLRYRGANVPPSPLVTINSTLRTVYPGISHPSGVGSRGQANRTTRGVWIVIRLSVLSN